MMTLSRSVATLETRPKGSRLVVASARAILAALLLTTVPVATFAADHAEAPGTKADPAADVADVFAWHDMATRRLVAAVTFDGLRPPVSGQRGTFSEGALYTLHLDRNGDQEPDADINIRFTRASTGARLVVVEGLPGAVPVIVGPVEQVLRRGSARVFAGLRDDPFFFDLEGFRQTLMTGTLSFDTNRDSFAGTNLTAVVLEMDLDAALAGGTSIDLWATTGRAPMSADAVSR
ncbi:MAG: DUF4331 family protein [Candidatus Eisenbacteria bacterium]